MRTIDRVITTNEFKPTPIVSDPAKNSSAFRNILGGLKNIKDRYDEKVGVKAQEYANSSIQKQSFDTDDELLEKAKESIGNTYEDKKKSAENKKDRTIGELVSEREASLDDYGEKLRALDRTYQNKEQNNLERLSRNGMTNSSVKALTQERIASDYITDRALLNKKEEALVKSLNDKIELAERSYRDALSSYEINYAIELENRLNKLKTQRDKLQSKYEAATEKETEKRIAEYMAQNEKENAEFEEEFGDYSGDKRANYKERLAYAVSEVKKLGREEGARFARVNENALKEYLGLYYGDFIRAIGG